MTKMMMVFFVSLIFNSSSGATPKCPVVAEKYGDNKSFQNIGCRIMISADEVDSQRNRNIIVNPEGLVQVFNNFPGTTNSNSTGARVYFLLPYRESENQITAYGSTKLSLKHRSGVNFNFDKTGRVSSPDIEIKVDSKINSTNKGGIEIQKYNKGLVIDLGWRMGNSPVLNPNAQVKITDKNGKTCLFLNNELHTISKYGAEVKFKTNEAFNHFLEKKCANLDLSDLKNPNLSTLSAKEINGNMLSPKESIDHSVNDSGRRTKKDVEIKNLFKGISTSPNNISR